MSQKSFDILAVGNAIIDVFSQCDDDFLRQHAIEKGWRRLAARRHLSAGFMMMILARPFAGISGRRG